ncbi:MAG: ABC transporter permease [Planctomycetota bacterium]
MSGWKSHPLVQLFLARFREFIRTPEAVFWGYGFPLVMVAALGLAFRSEPVQPAIVMIEDGPGADEAAAALNDPARFRVLRGSAEDCRSRLRSGQVEVVLVTARMASESAVEFRCDESRPGSLAARDRVSDTLQRAAGRRDPLSVQTEKITEPGSRYIDFLVPGLIGMGLMGGGVWGVGYAIVDMRIRQVLKRFLGTPMKKPHFVAAMMASRMVFMFPEIVAILVISQLMFDVSSHGGYGPVLVIVLLGAFQFASIGLIIASRARTLEAVGGLMNLTMVPMWIGSGIFFSSERFPDAVQPLIRILPLTPVISSLRQVMQEGAGLAAISPNLALMAFWSATCFLVALKIFRWD